MPSQPASELPQSFPHQKKRTMAENVKENVKGKLPVNKRTRSCDGNTLSVSSSKAFDDTITAEEQEVLHQFDLDITYGPCLGLTRSERYARAIKFGKSPPSRVKELLNEVARRTSAPAEDQDVPKHEQCLWQGRV
eukprot:TRINITY_DN8276_c0_g1_i1.p1 TRINITY_DN8276_c0_g1~~TRINITY_DN8276_c0_g1_i1.p1  ORF type:complete len:135 (+),score=28.68 TRINITY_DN8276_c0_g1_i1:185-589(+)